MKISKCGAIALAVMGILAIQAQAADDSKREKEAAHPEKVVYDAKSAFEFLKTMAGDWEHSGSEHEHGSASNAVNYRLTAGGSSVMETIFPGDAMEMISMYHMDGDTLLLTHYCALQNAPVMKFEKSDKPGEIKFVFHGGTNFDPKVDMHVHEGVLRIKDPNTVEAEFVGYSNGKPEHTPASTLKRKPAKLAKQEKGAH